MVILPKYGSILSWHVVTCWRLMKLRELPVSISAWSFTPLTVTVAIDFYKQVGADDTEANVCAKAAASPVSRFDLHTFW